MERCFGLEASSSISPKRGSTIEENVVFARSAPVLGGIAVMLYEARAQHSTSA
jgi:hypothetical protein